MVRTRFVYRTVLAGVLFLSASPPVSALTAVSNLNETINGTASTFFHRNGPPVFTVFTGEVAGSFVPGSAAQLTDVTLSLGASSGSTANHFTLQLFGNSGGSPSASLFTFTGNSAPVTSGLYTYTAPTPYSLTGGTTYWVVASINEINGADTSYGWSTTPSAASTGNPGWSIGRLSTYQTVGNSGGPWAPSSTTSVMFSVGIVAPPLPGDYNGNGTIDAADYVLWRKGGPLQNDATPGVQPGDYDVWRAHFGQTAGSGSGASANAAVPEPATLVLILAVGPIFSLWRRRIA